MKDVLTNQTYEQRYRVLIDNAPEPVFIFDASTFKFIDFNENAANFFKVSREELYKLGPLDLSPSKIDGIAIEDLASNYIEEAIEGGNPVFDWIHLNSDGREIPCKVRLVRFPPYEKTLIRASVIDKTNQIKLKDALEEREDRLQLALKASGLGSFDWYPMENITYWDNRMHELFGLSLQSSMDRNTYFFSVLHPDDQERIQQSFINDLDSRPKKRFFKNNYRIIKNKEIYHIVTQGYFERNEKGEVLRSVGTCLDVTEARNKEAKLQFNTEKLEEAQKLAKLGVFEKNFVKHSCWWSKGMYEIFEKPSTELTLSNKQLLKCIHPEDRDEFSAQAKICIEKGSDQKLEFRLLFTGGRIKYLNMIIRPVKNSKGNIVGINGITQDITGRKKSEEKLRESEERFSKSFNDNVTSMAIFNIETGVRLNVNDSFVKLFGYSREEMLSGSLFTNNLWVDEKRHKEVIQQLKKDRYLHNMSADFLNSAGEVIKLTINVDILDILDIGDGNICISTLIDETERKKAEEALQESEKRFQISTKAAKIGIWDWDITIDGVLWDDLMYAIYDIDKKKIITRDVWFSCVHPSDAGLILEAHKLALEGEKEFNIEHRIIWPDGSIRFIKATGAVQRNENGRPIRMIGTNWDISAEKEVERQKIRAQQLEIKNQELEQFAYLASHDLKEPIRSVKGFSEVLLKRYEGQLDEDAQKYLNFISDAASRMDRVTKGLLDYSRIGRNKEIAMVDCEMILKYLQNDLSAQISETNSCLEVAPLPKLMGFETEMRMLFQNLISNAMKFRKSDVTPIINITAIKRKASWEFCIKDNGIGIEPKFQKKIFVIFQRLHTRKEYEGTGIGLAHCLKIVELHGGTIWVDSKKGEGSAFYFTIPVVY